MLKMAAALSVFTIPVALLKATVLLLNLLGVNSKVMARGGSVPIM